MIAVVLSRENLLGTSDLIAAVNEKCMRFFLVLFHLSHFKIWNEVKCQWVQVTQSWSMFRHYILWYLHNFCTMQLKIQYILLYSNLFTKFITNKNKLVWFNTLSNTQTNNKLTPGAPLFSICSGTKVCTHGINKAEAMRLHDFTAVTWLQRSHIALHCSQATLHSSKFTLHHSHVTL